MGRAPFSKSERRWSARGRASWAGRSPSATTLQSFSPESQAAISCWERGLKEKPRLPTTLPDFESMKTRSPSVSKCSRERLRDWPPSKGDQLCTNGPGHAVGGDQRLTYGRLLTVCDGE